MSATAPSAPGRDALHGGFVCSEYPAFMPHHGGIGSFVHTMAHALVDDGHAVTVYGFGDRDDDGTDGGVVLHQLERAAAWPAMRKMQRRLAADLAAGTLDLIEAAEAEGHCLPRASGTVVRLHGGHHFWCATLPQPRRFGRSLLEQYALRRASVLCAVSRFAADVTRDAVRLGRRPIEVLSNPVDTSRFTPAPDTVRRGAVLFVGAITEKKGVRELCAAMPAIRRRHPHAQLDLVGRDILRTPSATPLREQILASLPQDEREHVRFLGPKPRHEISALMAAAHVCVFPSHMETQGIVLLEAMAAGRPVVASTRGPCPDVLGADGDCGVLVDPTSPADIADKVSRVLADDALAARMGERGRARAVEQFSLPVCLDRNVAFYRRHRQRR